MKSCDLAVSITALACCIAEDKSPEELALLSSIFMQLGDTLTTIAAQAALCETKDKNCNAQKNDE